MLEDLFSKRPLKRDRMICHSGGAVGSDTVWEQVGEEFGIKTGDLAIWNIENLKIELC